MGDATHTVIAQKLIKVTLHSLFGFLHFFFFNVDVLVKMKLPPLMHWVLLTTVKEAFGEGLIIIVRARLSLQPLLVVTTRVTI